MRHCDRCGANIPEIRVERRGGSVHGYAVDEDGDAVDDAYVSGEILPVGEVRLEMNSEEGVDLGDRFVEKVGGRDTPVLWVRAVHVPADLRGRGVGSKIMDEMERQVSVGWAVVSSLRSSLGFHARRGYQEVAGHHVAPWSSVVPMAKKLD